MNNVLIVTEANERVATGHLLESVVLAELLRERGYKVQLLINSDMPQGLKKRITVAYAEYGTSVETGYEAICESIRKVEGDMVIFDLRRLDNAVLCRWKKECCFTALCIDEFGGRRLDADIIVNPMIDPTFWDYKDSKAQLYAGPEYLILPVKLAQYHRRERKISKRVQRICISMGGVDLYGTTNKLAEWLFDRHSDAEWDVVLGAGFLFTERLHELAAGNAHVHVMQNIDNIYDVFERADLAFCAGGNTLHELACIGTPTIVIPTMEHEVNNGRLFEENGFGICLSRTDELCEAEVEKAFRCLGDQKTRKEMYKAGRSICTGDGGMRTVKIIEGCKGRQPE